MSPLSCSQVEEQIDLFAAAECEATTTAAIEHHLANCRSCREKVETARQLLGLLDLRLREADLLQRLQTKLEIESHRRRRPTAVLPYFRRFGAAAALVLLTFGLAGRLASPFSVDRQGISEPVVSIRPPVARVADQQPARAKMVPAHMEGGPLALRKDGPAGQPVIVQVMEKSGAEFREELRAGLASGRLSPQTVDLELSLFNPGNRELTLVINKRTEVEIDLQGPRVVTLPAPAAAPQEPIPAQTMTLPAGESRTVQLSRLQSVSPRGSSYTYWTEPGEYELKVSLRTEALLGTEGTRRRPVTLTVTSRPVEIHIVGKP
jgi:hypothetical protein